MKNKEFNADKYYQDTFNDFCEKLKSNEKIELTNRPIEA